MEQPNLVQPVPAYEAPKKKSKLGLILGIGGGALVLCVAFFLILFLVVLKATAPAADVGQAFMEALKAGNYRSAYAMCTADLKSEMGSADDLGALLETNDAVPDDWSFTSRNVENDQAQLLGTGTFSGGREADIEIVLDKVDGEWLVSGFHFNWK
jgi:hypothetical protein